VFGFLVCCYNITGVIIPDSKYDQFHIAFLADLALPGAIFDAESNMAYVTSIGQVILTMILNMTFREVATFCTQRENHKYKSTYENSLLVKRFMFEFFDCFLPLIYFGWWELNFKVLRQNVISLYVADELRRITCETILPYLLQNKSKISKDMYTLALSMKKRETQSEIEKHMQEGLKQMID
jgi:anoctamin-10